VADADVPIAGCSGLREWVTVSVVPQSLIRRFNTKRAKIKHTTTTAERLASR
jgi:hypothetical protein